MTEERPTLDTNAQLTAILRHLEMQTAEQKQQTRHLKSIATSVGIIGVLLIVAALLAFCNALVIG